MTIVHEGLSRAEMDEVEQMIDRSTLATVVSMLSLICAEKAEHIRSAWQDKETAKPWHAAAGKLDALASKLDI